jgi:cysteine synthase B
MNGETTHASGERDHPSTAEARSSVTVRIPAPLRPYVGGVGELHVVAATVRDALQLLGRSHPGLCERILDGDARLRGFVNLFVGDQDVRALQGLDTPVADGNVLTIVPAVAGGAAIARHAIPAPARAAPPAGGPRARPDTTPAAFPGATPATRPGAAAISLLANIGHTPLLRLDGALEVAPSVALFAKLESSNPGGSIKDRPVARMLRRALAESAFSGGRRLLDSSSGNAGIAYAMFGAALGIPVTLVVPGNASQERLQRIAAHGAELILTDPQEGYDFALREARRLAAAHADRYWHCDQYSNPENWRAHYEGTGMEILAQVRAQTGHAPDCFVAGVGTGGTLTGVGRRLREADPQLHVVTVVPETFPGIEGLKPLGEPGDIVPAILDLSLVGERMPVSSEQALAACRRLAQAGIFVGPSSGAYLHAALDVAARGRYRRVVTVFSDTGERYLSTGMWSASLAS